MVRKTAGISRSIVHRVRFTRSAVVPFGAAAILSFYGAAYRIDEPVASMTRTSIARWYWTG